MPEHLKEQYKYYKGIDLTRGRKAHWIQSAYELGLRNIDAERNGISYHPDSDIDYTLEQLTTPKPGKPPSTLSQKKSGSNHTNKVVEAPMTTPFAAGSFSINKFPNYGGIRTSKTAAGRKQHHQQQQQQQYQHHMIQYQQQQQLQQHQLQQQAQAQAQPQQTMKNDSIYPTYQNHHYYQNHNHAAATPAGTTFHHHHHFDRIEQQQQQQQQQGDIMEMTMMNNIFYHEQQLAQQYREAQAQGKMRTALMRPPQAFVHANAHSKVIAAAQVATATAGVDADVDARMNMIKNRNRNMNMMTSPPTSPNRVLLQIG